MWQLVITLSSL